MAGKKGRSGVKTGPSKARHRNEAQKEQDRTRMMSLLRDGYTKTMIGELLGIHQTQVTYDYKIVVDRLRKSQADDAKDYIAVKLEEYARIKVEAWEAWKRSKVAFERVVTEVLPEVECPVCGGSKTVQGKRGSTSLCRACKGRGTLGGEGKTTRTVEARAGDSSYLQKVLDCLKAERELLALDAPKTVQVKGSLQQTTINWDILTAGIPEDGNVPDVIEAEIEKAVAGLLPPPPATEPTPTTNGEAHE